MRSLTLEHFLTTWFISLLTNITLVTVCILLLDLVVTLAKFFLVLVLSVEDTPFWVHSLSWQPSLRAFPRWSFVTSFLYWSWPICTLVGSENPFLTACRQTTPSTHQEGRGVAMVRGRTGVIWRTQKPHNVQPNPGPAKPRCAIQIRDQHLRPCHQSSPVPVLWWQQMGSSRLHFQRAQCSWEELWSPWQGTSISQQRSWRMETHSRRD